VRAGLHVEQLLRADAGPQVPNAPQGFAPRHRILRSAGGADRHRAALEERRAGRGESAELRAGHGVSADEDHPLLGRSGGADLLLGAADVGEHRSGPHAGGEKGHGLQQRLRWRAEDHQIAIGQRGLFHGAGRVDRAGLQGDLARAPIDVDAGDPQTRTRPPQRLRERPTDQSQADDRDAFLGRHRSIVQLVDGTT